MLKHIRETIAARLKHGGDPAGRNGGEEDRP
jgi:hypothetical protein